MRSAPASDPVYLIGVGMTPFRRHSSTLRGLAESAVSEALADAAVSPDEVGAVYFANGVAGLLTGQEMIRGQVALRHTGLLGVPMVNVENACASGATAVHLAVQAVRAGACDIALAVGAEVLSHPDKQRSFDAIGSAVDLLTPPAFASRGGQDQTHSVFMELYAQRARDYMERTGATADDFARVAVKSRRFASMNELAQFRTPATVEEVLGSRAIVHPLTLMMCSPIGDGAAAIVIASERTIREKGVRQPVRVRASVLVSGRDRSDTEATATERAATAAYEVAGISPSDVDIAEVHDAAAPAELIAYEALGFCDVGDAPKLIREGATSLGGRRPVNTSGGLLSRGHPIGATGCAQLVELYDQLMGRVGSRQVPARVALAHNGGGNLGTDSAAMTVTLLTR